MWTIGATLDPRDPVTPGEGGSRIDVIAPPPGELYSETNNSVAILLTYGTARVLWLATSRLGRRST